MTVIAYDTEFLEGNGTIDLISIGLVRMMQLPAGIPMWTHDLRQELERAGNPAIPSPEGLAAHHALGDAREVMHRLNWLKEREQAA